MAGVMERGEWVVGTKRPGGAQGLVTDGAGSSEPLLERWRVEG